MVLLRVCICYRFGVLDEKYVKNHVNYNVRHTMQIGVAGVGENHKVERKEHRVSGVDWRHEFEPEVPVLMFGLTSGRAGQYFDKKKRCSCPIRH